MQRMLRRAARAQALLLAAAVLAFTGVAWSHGDWAPQHGGLMNEGGETSFELADHRDAATFYLSDHGKPLQTAGSTGTVEVLRGGREIARHRAVPGGADAMTVPALKLRPGDQVTFTLAWANGSVSIGRFSISDNSGKGRLARH